MKTINPDPASLPALLARVPRDTPVVMVNFLRFAASARYTDDTPPCSGREAWRRYAEFVHTVLPGVGGEVIYQGTVVAGLIAPADEQWDEMFLVSYPGFDAFYNMISADEYRRQTRHRTAALDDSRLIVTRPGSTRLP